MQLTALFALGVAILKWFLSKGSIGGDEIAELWLGTFVAIVTCRVFARWLAGRLSQVERCLGDRRAGASAADQRADRSRATPARPWSRPCR